MTKLCCKLQLHTCRYASMVCQRLKQITKSRQTYSQLQEILFQCARYEPKITMVLTFLSRSNTKTMQDRLIQECGNVLVPLC